ncbi:TRAP-type transport system periplasmic component-like protein [Caballeronia catudaia]|uniref:TRAP-type transport system periplasmic component-like protein n=1 Tax=Caballeronia catudaia TaxID=1777136 RepID=A0A158CPY6_9BURK|nr:TAXI family TRAP transporter solute-binding subunit [Caballeronia catudaia]SAK84378.1 TRAP-type transport system periplasmic component-like protein [Caballeronia catudaia]
MPRHKKAFHRRYRLPLTSRRRLLAITGAVILLTMLGWTLFGIVEPAFQTRIIMTTGADNGIYQGFAHKYAPILKRDSVTLDIRPSSGSVENYERLKDSNSEYEVGFIQSGTVEARESDGLQTIAAVSYEPIWVFYRGDVIVNRLAQLRGKRIGIGIRGSGLLRVSLALLAFSGVTRDNSQLTEVDAQAAYRRLEDGSLDAAFFIGRPDAPMQETLLNSDLKLVSFAQADAIVQKFPSLSKVTFPRASTSIVDDNPTSDVTLLASTALLVAKDALHPALVYLLLDAARTVHAGEDYFTPLGAFPNLNTAEFPVSKESERYFESGRPFLQRYLPFWLASFIERRLLILLPFMAVLIGIMQALPRMLESRVNNRFVVWYRALKSLEDEIWKTAHPSADEIARWWNELEYIDVNASRIRVPSRHLHDVYALKQAISVVRDRISMAAMKERE